MFDKWAAGCDVALPGLFSHLFFFECLVNFKFAMFLSQIRTFNLAILLSLGVCSVKA